MAQKYRIKNWGKFQHYTDRNPPWIKLHVEILASEDWVMLDDASKLLMVVCMILASKNKGCITADETYFKRVAYLCRSPNFNPLIECGFLEPVADASNPEHPQANVRPEKETEERQRREEKNNDQPRASRFGEFWGLCPKKVGKVKAQRLFDRLSKKTNPDLMIIGIRRYADSRVGEDPQFTKHPATWLSQRCWEDGDAEPNVIRPTAFNSPEELEGQRLARERLYGKA